MKKAVLRKSIIERLRALTPEKRRTQSEAICRLLVGLTEFQQAATVLLFAPLSVEPDVESLWELPESDMKRFAYPRITCCELELFEVRSRNELEATARWGLREPPPIPERQIPSSKIDLVIVPGVAFTWSGERLGRGGGFYDRLLRSTTNAYKVGVCFDIQLLPQLPIEPHDVAVDLVVTGHREL